MARMYNGTLVIALLLALALAHGGARGAVCPTTPSRFSSQSIASTLLQNGGEVAVADIDGDGVADLVTVLLTSTLAWVKNNGGGSFAPEPTVITNTTAGYAMVASDLDGDGDVDIAVGTTLDGVLVFLNANGSGLEWTQLPAFGVSAGGYFKLRLVDMDADGSPDLLATPLTTPYAVSWLRNNGSGWFSESPQLIGPNSRSPRDALAFHVNNDGALDVAIAAYQDDTVTVWTRNSTNGFGSPLVLCAKCNGAFALEVGDVDADGNARDLLVGSYLDNTISWFRHNGTAVTATRIVVTTGAFNVAQLQLADTNGDGVADIVALTAGDRLISSYRNDGFGGFATKATAAGARFHARFVAFDLDGNGLVDLAYCHFRAALTVALNYANVAYPLREVRVMNTADVPVAAALADWNNDGAIDVCTALTTELVCHRNDGTGLYSLTVTLPLVVTRLVAVDVDADGLVDLLTASELGATAGFGWLRNLDGAQFALAPTQLVAAASASALTPYDLNADGWLDVVVGTNTTVGVLMGTGPGAFAPLRPMFVSNTSALHRVSALAVGELDGRADNGPEVLVAWRFGGAVGWLPAAAVASLTPVSWPPADGGTVLNATQGQPVAVALIDADAAGGPLDVLVAARSGNTVTLYVNNGAGAFPAAARTVIATANGPTALAVADMNTDGRYDVVIASTFDNSIRLVLATGPATFAVPVAVLPTALETAFVALADMNNDGIYDVIAAASTLPGLSVRTTVPTIGAARMRLLEPQPAECAGIRTAPSCFAARLTAATSACFPAVLTLDAPVRGCFASPLGTGSVARVVINGAFNGSADGTFLCSSHAAQSVLEVDAGTAVTLTQLAVVVAADASPVETAGRSVFSVCSALCRATDTATLTLDRVTIVGFANRGAVSLTETDVGFGAITVAAKAVLTATGSRFANNTCLSGGAVVAVLGGSASVVIDSSVFADNSAGGSLTDDAAGGAAVLMLGTASTVTVTRSTFVRSRAGSAGGGVLAVNAPYAVATLRECNITDSGSDGGLGGAIVVRAKALGARVTLASSTVRSASATLAGGCLAIIGATSAQIVVTDSTLDGCAARYGGAVAAVGAAVTAALPDTLDGAAMAMLPRGESPTSGTPTITLGTGARLGATSATFGGAAFVCGGIVNTAAANLAAASPSASAGGLAFMCLPQVASLALPDAWLTLPSGGFAGTSSASAFGPLLASPPQTIELADFPLRLQSGAALGAGTAVARDRFAQVVSHSGTALVASVVPAPNVASAPVLASVGPVYAFDTLAVALSDWPDSLGASVTVLVALESAGGPLVGARWPSASASLAVDGCAPGWGRTSDSDPAVPLVCALCPADGYSTAELAAVGAACAVCPLFTTRSAGNATTPGRCYCLVGHYTPAREPDTACEPCPTGATCDGALAAPTAAAGFFPEGDTFVPCVTRDACLAGGQCARGYRGRLCGGCAIGYYALGARCARCNRALGSLATAALVLVGVATMALLLWLNLSRAFADSSYPFASASIALVALQTIALFGQLDFDWGPFAEAVFSLASLVSINVQLTSPECSLAAGVDPWIFKFWLTMLLPLAAAIATAFVSALALALARSGVIRRLAGLSAGELASGALRSWFQSLTLLYFPLISAALAVFACQRAGGKWILKADPSRECFDSRWWTKLFAGGLLCSLGYGLAVPTAVVLVLRRARARLTPSQFALRYAFAVLRFNESHWYFEATTMGFKLALALAFTAMSTETAKASMGVLVLLTGVTYVLASRPFRFRVHGLLSATLQVAVALVLLGGIFTDAIVRATVVNTAVAVMLIAIVTGIVLDLVLMRRERESALSGWALACDGHAALELEAHNKSCEPSSMFSASPRQLEAAPRVENLFCDSTNLSVRDHSSQIIASS